MLFLVEGPDGSGKTTFALQLSEMLNLEYTHFVAPKNQREADNLFVNYHTFVRENRDRACVVDRLWPSAQVYGKVMRGKAEITDLQADALEKALIGKGMIIYCTGEPAVLWNRCKQRGEDYVTDYGQFVAICREYERVMNKLDHRIPIVERRV